MEKAVFRISLDAHRQTTQAHLAVKKGDTARRIIITLTEGGSPYAIRDGCYAVFMGKKPDGNVLYNACTIENGQIVYDFTEQTVSAVGRMLCEVRLYGADDALITSPRISIIISGTVYADSEVESTAEFTALSEAMTDLLELKEQSEEFTVTVTGNDADGYAADKTYEEIQEARKQGQSCVCDCAGLLMPLVMLGGDAQFDTVWNGQEYRVYISPTGNVRVDISELGGGGSGGSGVYVGTEEPTDPNVYVWINPEGDADEPESGAEYVLPVATSETLGGVMPVAKTDDMTVPVGVDALGRLYAEAGSNNGGIDLPTGEWKQVFGFTTTEEVSILKIDVKDIVETLINSKKMMIKFEAMPVSSSAVIGSNPTGTFKWISGGAERIWLSNAMFLPWGTAESGEAHTGVLEIIKDTYSSNISIWHQYLKVANRSAQKAYNKDYIFGQSSGTTEHRFVITANDTVIGSGSTFKIFVI